jgi:hypothetical protein
VCRLGRLRDDASVRCLPACLPAACFLPGCSPATRAFRVPAGPPGAAEGGGGRRRNSGAAWPSSRHQPVRRAAGWGPHRLHLSHFHVLLPNAGSQSTVALPESSLLHAAAGDDDAASSEDDDNMSIDGGDGGPPTAQAPGTQARCADPPPPGTQQRGQQQHHQQRAGPGPGAGQAGRQPQPGRQSYALPPVLPTLPYQPCPPVRPPARPPALPACPPVSPARLSRPACPPALSACHVLPARLPCLPARLPAHPACPPARQSQYPPAWLHSRRRLAWTQCPPARPTPPRHPRCPFLHAGGVQPQPGAGAARGISPSPPAQPPGAAAAPPPAGRQTPRRAPGADQGADRQRPSPALA